MGDDERRVLQFRRSRAFTRRFPTGKQLFHEPNHRLETKRPEPTVQTKREENWIAVEALCSQILFEVDKMTYLAVSSVSSCSIVFRLIQITSANAGFALRKNA